MPKEQSVEIVGPGPTGARVFLLDGSGLQDVNGRMVFLLKEISWPLLAASVDTFIWTCREGVWQVQYATVVTTVVGGSGATVTVVVCPASVAIASGTAQLTAAVDLTTTAPAKTNGTLIASPTNIYPGDSVGIDLAGTLTGLVGAITVGLKKVG